MPHARTQARRTARGVQRAGPRASTRTGDGSRSPEPLPAARDFPVPECREFAARGAEAGFSRGVRPAVEPGSTAFPRTFPVDRGFRRRDEFVPDCPDRHCSRSTRSGRCVGRGFDSRRLHHLSTQVNNSSRKLLDTWIPPPRPKSATNAAAWVGISCVCTSTAGPVEHQASNLRGSDERTASGSAATEWVRIPPREPA